MSSSTLADGLRHLRGKLAAQERHEERDEHLLDAFLSRRDECAFAVLVRRHGPMVLNVCRRVLGHQQDAEDAFQATFLTLAQSAGSLRKKTALTSWLYGTAYRTALKAKQALARRHKYERQAPTRPAVQPGDELTWREVRTLLDDEIARLPEKYRSVFVLCCLKSVTVAETARRLGLKKGTVASRLAESRKRLGQRLARRGVELTALLAAATLTKQSASALSPLLISSTLHAAMARAAGEGMASFVSIQVADLLKHTTAATVLSKTKLASALLLPVSLLVGASLWNCFISATPQAAQQQSVTYSPQTASSQPVANEKFAPPEVKDEVVTVKGRVLDPDGKPVKGARLYARPSPRVNTTTDEEGRFSMAVPRFVSGRKWWHVRPNWSTSVVACADGFGLGWAEVPPNGAPDELTLRLVKDQPIHGRILNTEGKPLAGVRVGVVEVVSAPGQRLDAFLAGWKQSYNNAYFLASQGRSLTLEEPFLAVTTDTEGRFQLRGIGQERVVQLQVSGSGIAQGLLYVVARPGFDPAPINKTVQESFPQHARGPGNPPLLYGATILYVADPGRAMEGVIREAGSGRSVAGMTVAVLVNYISYAHAVTDVRGLFRMDGLPKQSRYCLQSEPGGLGPWMGTAAFVPDAEGLQTLKVELTVARGVVVTGQVIDRTTGKGVPSEVRPVPLPESKYWNTPGYDLYRYPSQTTPTDAAGNFRLVVVPGPSALLVKASAVDRLSDGTLINAFTQPEFSADDRKRVSVRVDPMGNRLLRTANEKEEFLPHQNACLVLDLTEDAVAVRRDVFLERGRTLTIHLQDPDGKPITGIQAGGLTDDDWNTFALKEASCTVYALRDKTPRPLAFVQPERRLACLLTLRGDEREALTVRLRPTGAMIGRLLDSHGQPLSGVRVYIDILDNNAVRAVDTQLRWRCDPIHTGADGRFRIDNVIPDLGHVFFLNKGKTNLAIEKPIGQPKVQSGETLDLGGLQTEPRG
jgi:RNA polymerase sigma factor (sigma-70 family)